MSGASVASATHRMPANDTSGTTGTGYLRSGRHDLGAAHYEIHVGIPNRPGTVVELESPPNAQDGEVLDLALEDGRVLQIHVRGTSPYCRVLGERPPHERRSSAVPLQRAQPEHQTRRRADARGPVAIKHPCPRCTGTDVLVTHRGVMLTTLFCTVCHHGWGVAPSVVASATRADRRTLARPDSGDRRAIDRLAKPVCEYCGTDTHVRSTRRTPHEVYFVCLACDAMWALPRPV
jgi:hypothetical protein